MLNGCRKGLFILSDVDGRDRRQHFDLRKSHPHIVISIFIQGKQIAILIPIRGKRTMHPSRNFLRQHGRVKPSTPPPHTHTVPCSFSSDRCRHLFPRAYMSNCVFFFIPR